MKKLSMLLAGIMLSAAVAVNALAENSLPGILSLLLGGNANIHLVFVVSQDLTHT